MTDVVIRDFALAAAVLAEADGVSFHAEMTWLHALTRAVAELPHVDVTDPEVVRSVVYRLARQHLDPRLHDWPAIITDAYYLPIGG